jgi:hypothetical protein
MAELTLTIANAPDDRSIGNGAGSVLIAPIDIDRNILSIIPDDDGRWRARSVTVIGRERLTRGQSRSHCEGIAQ